MKRAMKAIPLTQVYDYPGVFHLLISKLEENKFSTTFSIKQGKDQRKLENLPNRRMFRLSECRIRQA